MKVSDGRRKMGRTRQIFAEIKVEWVGERARQLQAVHEVWGWFDDGNHTYLSQAGSHVNCISVCTRSTLVVQWPTPVYTLGTSEYRMPTPPVSHVTMIAQIALIISPLFHSCHSNVKVESTKKYPF